MPDIKAQNETALASVKAIYDAADEANTLLDGMQTAATQAGTTLNGIYATAVQAEESAQDAQASADSASEYASRALGNLASVQSVTETLNWITAHGTMTLTSDTALDPSHVYFVVDANGDYVVGGTHYSVVSEPSLDDISTYYELSINESLNNYVATHLVVDTEGLWIIPDSGGNKVLIATGSGSTYTTAGTYIINGSTVLASFTANGIQVGQTGESHLEMDYHSMQLKDKEGDAYFYVSDLRDKDDGYQATITETFIGDGVRTVFMVSFTISADVSAVDSSDASNTATRTTNQKYTFASAPADGATVTIVYKTVSAKAKAYTFGARGTGNVGAMSVAEGQDTIASGINSHAEGQETIASGINSHAEGTSTEARGSSSHSEGYGSFAFGVYAHAEGYNASARGKYSHAEGKNTLASGMNSHAEGTLSHATGASSHAEGSGNIATGDNSHSEGTSTEASGIDSHAEGHYTHAIGQASHAQNTYTVAQRKSQTVLGEYNIADTGGTDGTTRGDYVFIIGNGTSESARSNAFAITWDGNAHMALDTTATSGTDKEIYDALVSLGWDSDCIV